MVFIYSKRPGLIWRWHRPTVDYIDGALDIYIGFDDQDPDEILLTIGTTSTIWGFLTPDGENFDLARLNNPRLADLLRRIELEIGKEFFEWEGELGMKIGHYGFLPDSIKDRQKKH